MADGGPSESPEDLSGQAASGREKHSRLFIRGSYVRLFMLIGAPVAVIVVALLVYLNGGRYVTTDNAYVKGGLLPIATDVSGIVAGIEVRDNQHVRTGDVLFRLDDEPFRLKAAAAEAKMNVTRIEIENLHSLYLQKMQSIEVVKQDLDFYTTDYESKKTLLATHSVAQRDVDDAYRAMQGAKRRMAEQQEDARGALINLGGEPDIPIEEHPRYAEARAEYDQAMRDLRQTVVKAPMDGVLANVDNLQVGTYLPAATPAFSLVGSSVLWVEANPKETDLTHVKPGQNAAIAVDTYPGQVWNAVVDTISPATGAQFSVLPPQNASGNWVKVVQRIPVRLRFDAGEDISALRSGMSVEIEIDTGNRRTLSGLIGLDTGR